MSSNPEPTTPPTTDQSDDSDWGFKPRKSGMSGESKIALMLVVCLAGVFTFVVYKKLEGRKQLLAQEVSFEDGVQTPPDGAASGDEAGSASESVSPGTATPVSAASPTFVSNGNDVQPVPTRAGQVKAVEDWRAGQSELTPAAAQVMTVAQTQTQEAAPNPFAPAGQATPPQQPEPEPANPFAPAQTEPSAASSEVAAGDRSEPLPLFDFKEPAQPAAVPAQPAEEVNPFAPREMAAQSPPAQPEPQFEPGPFARQNTAESPQQPEEPVFMPFAPAQDEPEVTAAKPPQTEPEPNPFFVDEGPSPSPTATATVDATPAEFTPFPAPQPEPGPAMTPPRSADSGIQPVQHERSAGNGLDAAATIEVLPSTDPSAAPGMSQEPAGAEPADDPFFMPIPSESSPEPTLEPTPEFNPEPTGQPTPEPTPEPVFEPVPATQDPPAMPLPDVTPTPGPADDPFGQPVPVESPEPAMTIPDPQPNVITPAPSIGDTPVGIQPPADFQPIDPVPTTGGDAVDVHVVQQNENFWTISRRWYGRGAYFSALAAYNSERIPDPRKMRPGMKVLIPQLDVLVSRYPELVSNLPRSATSIPQQPSYSNSGFFLDTAGNPRYRIGKNDTLTEIARRHLGRSSRWIQIYGMNGDVLSSPEHLKIGTVLRLPHDASNIGVVR